MATPPDPSLAASLTQRLRLECVLRLRRHRLAFFPLIRTRQRFGHNHSVRLPHADTDLVVEGYFRCANHYVMHALALAHDDQLDIAGLSHAPAVVRYACARSIPTLVLIREPDAVTLSNLLKHPMMSPAYTLRGYIDFYQRLLPQRDRFVVGEFEQVTADLGPVIDALNARYHTAFRRLPDTPEAAAALEDRLGGRRNERRPVRGAAVADVPTAAKDRAKADARARLETPALEPLRQRARGVYERFVGG